MIGIILDTETTGTDHEVDEVIELAFMPWNGPGEVACSKFKPSIPIKFGAMNTHHILPFELEECAPSSLAPSIIPAADYWIAHNVDFDWRMMGQPPVARICTLAMARSLWPDLDSHQLGAVAYYLFGATEETRAALRGAHTAAADVLMCQRVLQEMLKVTGITTLPDLYDFSEDARIPKIMTFGKHRGKRIEEVDRGYVNWYRSQPDPDPYLLKAFKQARLM